MWPSVGIGRRTGLKIRRTSLGVWVQVPPPAPSVLTTLSLQSQLTKPLQPHGMGLRTPCVRKVEGYFKRHAGDGERTRLAHATVRTRSDFRPFKPVRLFSLAPINAYLKIAQEQPSPGCQPAR